MTNRIRIADLRHQFETGVRNHGWYLTETEHRAGLALLGIAQAAHEAAKASHVQNTDPARMHDAWDALDDALNRIDFT